MLMSTVMFSYSCSSCAFTNVVQGASNMFVNAKVTTGLVYLCQEVSCHIPFDVKPNDVN